MKCDVLKRVMKKRFVMLLINLKICRIGECEKIDEEIKRLLMIVKRGKRKNVVNFFDRETIFVYDIDFSDVVDEKTNETNKVRNAIVVKEEINEKSETNEKDFFVCFVRT